VDVELFTAIPSPVEDTRYLSASLQNVLTEIAWNGRSAKISGDVLVAGDVSRLWVVATAYDANGRIVGIRRWESVSDEKKVNLTVASLGSTIDHVLLNVEAKP